MRKKLPKLMWQSYLEDADGILVPGGFGDRGIEGKIAATEYARVKKVPFLRYLFRYATSIN